MPAERSGNCGSAVDGETNGYKIFRIFNYLLCILATLLCFFPFYYLFINSISSNELSANGMIVFFPREIHLSNYAMVYRIPGLLHATVVSLSRTFLGTVLSVISAAFLGFLFTKKKMWQRKFWYRFVILTMYFNAGLIPWFVTMNNLGLVNNFWAYIIPALVQPYNIILVKTFMESTPISLQEAAEIDGAGIYTVFFRIILPICIPILATITIFCAVGQWNSFYDTLLLITDEKLYTLQFLLYRYLSQAESLAALIRSSGSSAAILQSSSTAVTPTAIRMTVSIVVVLPIILVYPYFQKYFIKGMMIGAVKG